MATTAERTLLKGPLQPAKHPFTSAPTSYSQPVVSRGELWLVPNLTGKIAKGCIYHDHVAFTGPVNDSLTFMIILQVVVFSSQNIRQPFLSPASMDQRIRQHRNAQS